MRGFTMKEKINEHELLVDCGGIREILLIHPLVGEKEKMNQPDFSKE